MNYESVFTVENKVQALTQVYNFVQFNKPKNSNENLIEGEQMFFVMLWKGHKYLFGIQNLISFFQVHINIVLFESILKAFSLAIVPINITSKLLTVTTLVG